MLALHDLTDSNLIHFFPDQELDAVQAGLPDQVEGDASTEDG